MTTRVILTYADYAAIPADGRRYELHEGEVSVTLAPSPPHQEVLGSLFALLREHVKSRGLGKVFPSPIDCMLSDTTVVQPDMVYVASGSLPAISRRGIEGPPTLVVEVLSPSTIQIDRGVKFQLALLDRGSRSLEHRGVPSGGGRV
jgi:Uma2 family endonuclease